MFDDARGLEAAKAAYGPAAGRMINRHGERIWRIMRAQDGAFSRGSIIKAISDSDVLTYKSVQMQVGAFFAYYLACPETFKEPRRLREIGRKVYQWASADSEAAHDRLAVEP